MISSLKKKSSAKKGLYMKHKFFLIKERQVNNLININNQYPNYKSGKVPKEKLSNSLIRKKKLYICMFGVIFINRI